MVLGGVQSLIVRMACAMSKRDIPVKVYYRYIDDVSQNEFEKNGINIEKYSDKIPNFLSNVELNDNKVIVFDSDLYLRILNGLRIKKTSSSIYLYVVHPYTFEKFSIKKPLHRLFKKSYAKYLKKSIINKQIFFMDVECIKFVDDYYKLHLDRIFYTENVLPLIFDIPDYDKNDISNIVEKKSSKHILTVARSSFPFKGYFKGLIEIVKQLNLNYEDCLLTIVTSGEGVSTLQSWIEKSGLNNISVYCDLSQNELKELYKDSMCYIGMGTTILEASRWGTIAIPVAPYTYECKSNGLFFSNPEWLLTEIGEGENCLELIISVLEMDRIQYENIVMNTYNKVSNIYSSSAVLEKLQYLFKECDSRKIYDGYPYLFMKMKNIKGNLKNVKKLGDRK